MDFLLDEELKLRFPPTLETAVSPINSKDVLPVFGKDSIVTHLYLLLKVTAFELALSHLQPLVVDAQLSVGGWLRHQLVSVLNEFLQDLCIIGLLELLL